MSGAGLFASGMVRTGVVAVTAAVGAVGVGAVLSPLLPLGTARIAEPHNGFAFDAVALSAGGVGVVVVLMLIGAGITFHIARVSSGAQDASRARPSQLSGAAITRLPLVMALGIRLALHSGGGRSAVPVRATLAAVAVGVASMAAA